jgi:hypothetical protein
MDELQKTIGKRLFHEMSNFDEQIAEFRELFQKTKSPTQSKMRALLTRLEDNDVADNCAPYMKSAFEELHAEFPTCRDSHIFSKIMKEKQRVVTYKNEYITSIAFYIAMTVVCECPERDFVVKTIKHESKVEQSLIDEFVAFFHSEHFTIDFDVLAKILLALNRVIYEFGNNVFNAIGDITNVASCLFVLFDCMKYR